MQTTAVKTKKNEMVARRLYAIRAAGLRQGQIAKRLGVSDAYLSLTVLGHRTNMETRYGIAVATQADFKWLWGSTCTLTDEEKGKIEEKVREAA